MQREEQGWMRPYLRSDAPKQAPIVEFDPAGKAWNTPIGEANKGSHKVIVDAGVRTVRDYTFRAWHSPNVKTETIPVEAFVDFGIAQEFITRKIKTVQSSGVRIKGASTKDALNYGELDDIDIGENAEPEDLPKDAPDDDAASTAPSTPLTGHSAYVADKKRHERGLDAVYVNFVRGVTPIRILHTRVWRHISHKASSQQNLGNVRSEPVKDVDDYVQDFMLEVWPKIEAKTITGPLSFWLNKAFKLHFIDAQKDLTREWDERRYLAGLAARSQGVQDTEWTERLQEAPRETLTGDDSPQPQPSEFYDPASRDEKSNPYIPKPIPVPILQFSRRIKDAAVLEFLKRHQDDIHQTVWRLLRDGQDGATIARALEISEQKVSRLKVEAEREVLEIGQAMAEVAA
jgi:DNA-directed RNA polymerase specialized sigma24 family protein